MTIALLAPPPTADATSREFLTALGAAGLLTTCAASATADRTGPPRVITHQFGETTLSAQPAHQPFR